MLTKTFFDQWIEYLCQVKNWQLTIDAQTRIYETASELSDADFGAICDTTSKTVGGRPDTLISGITDRLRQLRNDRPALPAGAIDPTGKLEGIATMKWQISYTAARKINPSLPALSHLNPNGYGVIQEPLAPVLYQQILSRFGSWQNAPLFVKGRCAPIEQMIESLWNTQLNPPSNPFDQPVGTPQPKNTIGAVINEIYRGAA
jgi:hypothetical protein